MGKWNTQEYSSSFLPWITANDLHEGEERGLSIFKRHSCLALKKTHGGRRSLWNCKIRLMMGRTDESSLNSGSTWAWNRSCLAMHLQQCGDTAELLLLVLMKKSECANSKQRHLSSYFFQKGLLGLHIFQNFIKHQL